MSEPFGKMKFWVLGVKEAAQKALGRSLTIFHMVTKVKQPGYRQGNNRVAPAGKVAWPVDPDKHDGVGAIASDAFFAEYSAIEGKVYCLDDPDGTRHDGADPLNVANPLSAVAMPGGKTPNVHIGTDPYQSGFGVVIRTAEYGTKGLDKNVFFRLGPLVAHHRDPNQPFNSSLVHDPGMGEDDWAGGLHYPLRVRGFIRNFCLDDSGDQSARDTVTGAPVAGSNFVYAPLLNFTRNGDNTVAHGAAHFANGEAVLSHEAKGFIAPADDGTRHLAGIVRYPQPLPKGLKGVVAKVKAILAKPPNVNVYQGGINISEALFGSSASGIVYSPVEFINAQWIDGAKGPYETRVEFREDMNDFHFNICGKKVKGRKKWMGWQNQKEYPPTLLKDPGGDKESDPGSPKSGDPPTLLKDPGGTKTSDPGGGKKGDPGGTKDRVPEDGDPTPKGLPPVGPADEIGPVTQGDKGPRDGSRSSAAGPAQVEVPSVMGHAAPLLPDGVDRTRAGSSEHDQAWLSKYGFTEKEFIQQPVVADTVAVAIYESATPNNAASGADRWSTVRSQDAVFATDVQGRVLTRDKPALGAGSIVDIPSNVPDKCVFVENRTSIVTGANAFCRIILAAKNAAGATIDGRFGLGSRILTNAYVASGVEFSLDLTDTTNPTLRVDAKDETATIDNTGGGFTVGPVFTTESKRKIKYTESTSSSVSIDNHHFLQLSTALSSITATLPAVTTDIVNRVIHIRHFNINSNTLTIARNGATIDGVAADLVVPPNTTVTLVCASAISGGAWITFNTGLSPSLAEQAVTQAATSGAADVVHTSTGNNRARQATPVTIAQSTGNIAGLGSISRNGLIDDKGQARVFRTTSAQALSAATWTKVQFNSETFDTDSLFDNATNYRYTPTKAGKYTARARILTGVQGATFVADPAGQAVNVAIYKNGSAVAYGTAGFDGTSGKAYVCATAADEIDMNGSTDYLEVFAYIEAGGNVVNGTAETYASFERVD